MFRSRNRSVHGTVPYTELFCCRNRSMYSTTKAKIHIYISIDICIWTFGVHYTAPFRLQNCSIHGTVPYILRQKRKYIYISIDFKYMCWTFGVHYTEPFRSRNHSFHGSVPFTEPFSNFREGGGLRQSWKIPTFF